MKNIKTVFSELVQSVSRVSFVIACCGIAASVVTLGSQDAFGITLLDGGCTGGKVLKKVQCPPAKVIAWTASCAPGEEPWPDGPKEVGGPPRTREEWLKIFAELCGDDLRPPEETVQQCEERLLEEYREEMEKSDEYHRHFFFKLVSCKCTPAPTPPKHDGEVCVDPSSGKPACQYVPTDTDDGPYSGTYWDLDQDVARKKCIDGSDETCRRVCEQHGVPATKKEPICCGKPVVACTPDNMFDALVAGRPVPRCTAEDAIDGVS